MSGAAAVNDLGTQDPPAPPPVPPQPPVQDTLVLPPEPEPKVEPEPKSEPKGKAPRTFSEEEVEAIRKQEKDKLYEGIEATKAELAELRREREEREAKAKADQEAAEAAAKKAAEEEMSAKELLAQREQEWQARMDRLEADRQRDQALLQREREFAALQDYKAIRMAEFGDQILPELRELVSGASEEEIDNSVSSLVKKTEDILGNVAAVQQQQRQQQRGVSVSAPPVGPMENQSEYESVTADDIRNMDMATYAKNRGRLLGAVQSRVSERGLYG